MVRPLPGRQQAFVEIYHEIFSRVILSFWRKNKHNAGCHVYPKYSDTSSTKLVLNLNKSILLPINVSKNCWRSDSKQCRPRDQMPQSVAFDLGGIELPVTFRHWVMCLVSRHVTKNDPISQ